MRYRRTFAAVAVFSVAAFAPGSSPVDAATERFEGEVVEYNGAPVAGVEVTVTELGATTPAGSATTDSTGMWAIDVAAGVDEYHLFVDGGSDYQSGYRGCLGYLYPDESSACTIGPGFFSTTLILATYVSGTILDSVTSAPVAGAAVSVFREDGTTLMGSNMTAADGTYRVDGIDHEEIGIQVDGTAADYGIGWFVGPGSAVAPTFGAASTHLPGAQSVRYLDAAGVTTYRFEGVVTEYDGSPVAGIEVIATAPGVSGTAWTATTDADGYWTYGADDDEYDLYVDGGSDYQSGYRRNSGYLYPDPFHTAGPGVLPTYVVPSYVSGRILDSATSVPVAGAIVSVYREDGTTFVSSAMTAADGTYRVDGVTGEEIGIEVDGTAVGYGTGWFTCEDGTLAPTFGAACTHLPGPDGDRFLDAVEFDPPRFRLRSRDRTGIRLIVRDPGTDLDVLAYELTCRSLWTRETTTVVYETDRETRYGFDRGINRCRLQVLTPAGEGPDSRARWIWVR